MHRAIDVIAVTSACSETVRHTVCIELTSNLVFDELAHINDKTMKFYRIVR